MKKEIVLILHDIRSAQNTGAMFRTAEAVGLNKIYLTGYTPAPLDRFGRERKDITKSALGAEKLVKWEAKKSLPAVIRRLRRDRFYIIAIEQSPKSIDYKKVSARGGPAYGWKKLAFIVGNEVTGLPSSILKKCDVIAEIPMQGRKESLNVSVALGVAIFRILNI